MKLAPIPGPFGIEHELDAVMRRTGRTRRAQYYRRTGDTRSATRLPPSQRVACEFRAARGAA